MQSDRQGNTFVYYIKNQPAKTFLVQEALNLCYDILTMSSAATCLFPTYRKTHVIKFFIFTAGPPNYNHYPHSRHHCYHRHQHYHHNHHQHIYRGACQHSHHTCRHHHCPRHHITSSRPPEGSTEGITSPQQASPEVSDLDLQNR